MNYSIIATDPFAKELKHLVKKFLSIKKDIALLAEKLLHEPMLGTPIGNDCYKIRMAITSKGKGKSGVQESLLISGLLRSVFIYYRSMINQKLKILQTMIL